VTSRLETGKWRTFLQCTAAKFEREGFFLIRWFLKRKNESASELFSKTIFSVLNLKVQSQATELIVTIVAQLGPKQLQPLEIKASLSSLFLLLQHGPFRGLLS
jgi:hypothetical protein